MKKKKHSIKIKVKKHPTQPNTFMYAPIRHLSLEQVWYTINTMSSPWGASNEELFFKFIQMQVQTIMNVQQL